MVLARGPRAHGNYDFTLEYDGQVMPFVLHRDGDGNPLWFPTLAPSLQPQFQTGDYGYELTPSEVDIPLSYQDFSLGAGFDDDLNESPGPGPRSYSYSRGVDASEGTRLYLSPLQVAGSGVAAASTKTIKTSLGTFKIAGRYVYELTTAPDAWTERYDTGTANTLITDIIEYKGVLFIARAGGATPASYAYSSNGTAWTVYSDASVIALYWATRDDVLWHVTSGSQVANNQAGTAQNGGTAWSAADNVGHSGESVRGLLEIDNDLYIFKEEGIYRYTGSATEDVWLGGKNMRRTTNGLRPYLWHDQRTYVPYGDRLLQFDHTIPSLKFIFPTVDMRGHPEINGQIAAITGDANWLYVCVYNADGNSYIMKGNPYHNGGQGEWHTYVYLGAVTCEDIAVIGPAASEAPSTTNPVLLIANGTAAAHYVLPRNGWRPEDDANVAFESTGTLYGSHTGFGAMAFPKFLNGGDVTARNLSSTETVRLSYEVEESGTPIAVLTATETGTTRESILTTVEFHRVRPVIRLATGSSAETPIMVAAVLHATPNPPRRHSWTFMVQIADEVEMLGGGRSRYTGEELEAFLFGAVHKRVTMTDKRGRQFIIKVNSVAGTGPGGQTAE